MRSRCALDTNPQTATSVFSGWLAGWGPGCIAAVALGLLWLAAGSLFGQQRIYLAVDDHTDFIWSDTEANYTQHFLKMLDFYLAAANADVSNAVPVAFQSRFNTDGAYWLWIYERNRSATQFNQLLARLKSGHINSPMTALCVTYGGMPAEAVLRSMYYAGRLERRSAQRFDIAQTMENMTMPYGLVSLWAGAGAKFSWNGVCNCATAVPGAYNRPTEIYRWRGADGRSLTMKWYSMVGGNTGIGGYAEARDPGGALAEMAGAWANRYRDLSGNPFSIKGAFGQGWDDLLTTNFTLKNFVVANDSPAQRLFVSNEKDFFADFETTHGSGLTNFNASFGNEWDVQPASLAEVSASVKRDVELLRSAEALATLVSLKNPGFMSGRETARDLAFMDLGLYFEHDFGDGGPGASATERRAFQKRLKSEIHSYVTTLFADAKLALGGLIASNGPNPRFYAFNPLGWARTDFADLPYTNAQPAHVLDVSTAVEVPSQPMTNSGGRFLRIQAPDVPPLGYKVFEVVPGAGASFTNPFTVNAATGQLENDHVALTVTARGSISSFVDKKRGNRQFRGSADLNLLGASTGGTLTVENAGPVSTTLKAVSSATLPHTTRLTLFRDSDRVDVANEITANFSSVQRWQFSFNLTNVTTWHEEVGAITCARLTSAGGHYSPSNARYDFLTFNHFADMTGNGPFGVTLANADTYFLQLGNSSTAALDSATPTISAFAGGQLGGFGCGGQDGDSYFLQRFALRTHDAFDQPAAMRFALEHQNPLVCAQVTGATSVYPATNFSFGVVSDTNILVWALKPAEEGITNGVILRVWNLATSAAPLAFTPSATLSNAIRCTHLETDLGSATVTNGTLVAPLNPQLMETFRLFAANSTTFNQPPSVALDSPTNGASFLSPANIAMLAHAADNDGTVTQVVFRAGDTVLGSDTNSTASFNWLNVTDGHYALTAVAFDNLGASATSAVVNVVIGTITNSPPVVTLTAPTNNAVFLAPATITLAADASDPDGSVAQVAFYNGASLLTTVTTSPFTFTWNAVSAGTYSLSAVATDNLGASATSAVVVVTVTNPPVVNCAFPSSSLLDDFQRGNGTIGANWSGATSGYAIVANQLHVGAGDLPIYWQVASYGSNQEAFVTLNTVDAGASEMDLLLKVQGSGWGSGALEIWYQAAGGVVQVWTYAAAQDWQQRGTNIPVTFANGDRFGARAKADGTVEVYRNGALLGSTSVAAWPFYASGGRVGLWMINAAAAVLDDFGGGDVQCCVCTATNGPVLSVTRTATNSLALTFSADGCCAYTLQTRTNLTVGNWETAANFPAQGTNSVINFTPALNAATPRFYRLASP